LVTIVALATMVTLVIIVIWGIPIQLHNHVGEYPMMM
jgi:hypothetical protein